MNAEKLLLSFKESNKIQNAICLRLFNVYGEGHNNAYTGVIAKFSERLKHKLAPIIYGDGIQTRDFVSVKDVVDAVLIAIDSNGINDIFNIGTGHSTSINLLARKMIEIARLNIEPIYEHQNLDNEIKHSIADVSKALRVLKFRPKTNLSNELPKLGLSLF